MFSELNSSFFGKIDCKNLGTNRRIEQCHRESPFEGDNLSDALRETHLPKWLAYRLVEYRACFSEPSSPAPFQALR